MWIKIAAISLGLSIPAFSQLSWQETSISKNAAPSDKEAVAGFHFTNSGKETVVLKSVETTCDCITTELVKKEYAPGESGEVKVTFSVSGRIGLQHKTVEVLTDDIKPSKTTLSLNVNIQEPVQMSPTVLWWRLHDEKKTQQIHVTVADGNQTLFTGIDCSNPDWKVELKAITPGREYYVEATPLNTDQANSALITLKSETPMENARTFTARLRVQ